MNADRPDQHAIAAHLRAVAARDEPVPPEALFDIADMLHPPQGYKGPTLKLVLPKGGKPRNRRWLAMASAANTLTSNGWNPDAAVFKIAGDYNVSERTVRRALSKFHAIARDDIQSTH